MQRLATETTGFELNTLARETLEATPPDTQYHITIIT